MIRRCLHNLEDMDHTGNHQHYLGNVHYGNMVDPHMFYQAYIVDHLPHTHEDIVHILVLQVYYSTVRPGNMDMDYFRN